MRTPVSPTSSARALAPGQLRPSGRAISLVLSCALAVAGPVHALHAQQPPALLSLTVDTSHTTIGFGVRHLGLSTVRGQFTRYAITLAIDTSDFARSEVNARIEAASLNTGHAQRDADLRSERYLDVGNHPEITFSSRRVEVLPGRALRIVGDLSIRGITREVVLDGEVVDLLVARSPQQAGLLVAGFRASTRISRKDFGLSFNRLVEGVAVVGDEVRIDLEVEGRHQRRSGDR